MTALHISRVINNRICYTAHLIDVKNGPSGIIETQVIDHRGGQKKLIRGGTFISDEELEKPWVAFIDIVLKVIMSC